MKNKKRNHIMILLILGLFAGCVFIKPPIDNKVQNAIDSGVDYLITNQNDDGSISLNNDETFKVWETANTILVVNAIDNNKKVPLEKATNFLLNVQRNDSSFYHAISFEKGYYCMETTPISTLALVLNGHNISEEVSFMLNLQNTNGSWEIGTPPITKDRYFPSINGFVLSTLMCLDIFNENVSKGIEHIQESQFEDGSWGSSWMYYGTPYYATYPNLLALRLYGLEKSNNYKKAIKYIKQNQNEDGSWGEENSSNTSRALRTSLALNSLLIYPKYSDSESIEKGVRWLISSQNDDGFWEGGYFASPNIKNEDIFATTMTILALKRYQLFQDNRVLLCLN